MKEPTVALDRLLESIVHAVREHDAFYRECTGGQQPTIADVLWEIQKTLVRELRRAGGVKGWRA